MAEQKPQVNAEDLRRQMYAAQLALRAKESRASLLSFAQFMMPDPNNPDDAAGTRYQIKPHHHALAEALDEVADGKNLRVIVSMPPQHGKSQLTSRMLPPYLMGRQPWKHLMLGTYSQDFAEQFGGDVREVIESPRYGMVFPEVRLKDGSRARDYMVTEQGGKLSFLGRGGAGTGKPADYFLIDDPLKDAMEAESPAVRESAWQWFTKVAYTRCHVLSAIVITMTRWHEDDIVGRLTDKNNKHYDADIASQWLVINLPAIITKEDGKLAEALGMKLNEEGEAALWPERFPLTHLHTARKLNPIGFSALYQGRPTPPEGAFFKRAQIVPYKPQQLPKNLRMYGSCDLAVSPDRDADSSVIANWGLDENDDLWLLPDIYWEKKAADESVDAMIAYAKSYGWQTLFGEKGVIDRAVGPFLEKRMMEPGSQWFHVETYPAVGSKGSRCVAIRGRMAQRRVHMPTFAPWWPRAEHQMLKFTGTGKDPEDDFCDMLGLIGMGLGSQFKASAPEIKSNVVQIGTMRWVKAAHLEGVENSRRHKARKGF